MKIPLDVERTPSLTGAEVVEGMKTCADGLNIDIS